MVRTPCRRSAHGVARWEEPRAQKSLSSQRRAERRQALGRLEAEDYPTEEAMDRQETEGTDHQAEEGTEGHLEAVGHLEVEEEAVTDRRADHRVSVLNAK